MTVRVDEFPLRRKPTDTYYTRKGEFANELTLASWVVEWCMVLAYDIFAHWFGILWADSSHYVSNHVIRDSTGLVILLWRPKMFWTAKSRREATAKSRRAKLWTKVAIHLLHLCHKKRFRLWQTQQRNENWKISQYSFCHTHLHCLCPAHKTSLHSLDIDKTFC